MTEPVNSLRLYYENPYLIRFSAQVMERLHWHDRPAVVLDRTAFYPTGGGQPHDTGFLRAAGSMQDVAVLDVVEREPDGAILHLLTTPVSTELVEAGNVEGEVNWTRRFDLMQQHTGQHILSAAFVERFGANTVGFHLSDEYATIDLDRAPISDHELAEIETLANAIVFDNRQAVARFVPDAEVADLPLRKPLAHEGPVRVVEIPAFDCSACGGTHVRATGEVGLIKITRSERRGTETRIEFLCGWRALRDYQAKNATVMDLARDYTVGHWEVAAMVQRMADELKETRRELRNTRDAWLDAKAEALWRQGQQVAGAQIVSAHLANHSPDDLKHLAQRLVTHPHTVALLAAGEAGQKGFFTFARSADVEAHMGTLVRQACELVGGRGGGRPEFAQGGGPEGNLAPQALEEALRVLANLMTTRDM
jgi:alanyl-tRNA synthetase